MNIKFLGTSFGAPSKGRCQPSVLVETDKFSYLIDVGAPVLDILINSGYDLKKIKAIFITHMHGDHINGLFDILNLAGYYKLNLNIYVSEQCGIKLFEDYCIMQSNGKISNNINFKLIKQGNFYDDGNLKITSFPTSHMEASGRTAYGFLIKADDKKAYFTGDLHCSLKDFPEFLSVEPVDMIVTECAHFSAEAIIEKLKNCKTSTAAIVHVMPTEKYKDFKKYINDIPLKIVFPKDNDEYTI